MRKYLILYTMNDGTTREVRGLFLTDWQAIDTALGVELQGLRCMKLKREA